MSASADVRILPVPLWVLPEVLPLAAPHLVKGAAVSALDMVQLTSDLMADLAALWCIFDRSRIAGAFFTSVHADEGGNVVHVYGLGGTGLHRWADRLSATMQRHAKANGCRAVRFHGRPAWARVLPDFRPIGTDNGATLYERAIA